MKTAMLCLVCPLLLQSCNPIFSSISDNVESIVTDEAVLVEINRAALSKGADIEVFIHINNP